MVIDGGGLHNVSISTRLYKLTNNFFLYKELEFRTQTLSLRSSYTSLKYVKFCLYTYILIIIYIAPTTKKPL